MVPLSVVLGGLAVLRLVNLLQGSDTLGAFGHANTGFTVALTASFYLLVVWSYMRRGRASATTRVRSALLAGPVATFLPFGLPFLGAGGTEWPLLVVGDLLLVVGLGFSVWSLRCLDRSLSVVPQARSLVQHGPYSRVRHPLYLGELVAMLGLALTLGGPGPLLLWGVLATLQGYRAVHEERLLTDALPEYAAYAARTARILPGVF